MQQGLNDRSGMARRYHWHSAAVRDFVAEPHSAIVGENQGTIMNLVDAQAKPAQTALLDIARENPDPTLRRRARTRCCRVITKYVRRTSISSVSARVLAVAYERDLRQFAELLLLEKLGPRTLQSLALIAEVVHGAPSRFTDPARFSFAHGGKDGHPFPVPLKTYDESLNCLRTSLELAKLGDKDKLEGFHRLERFRPDHRNRLQPEADFDAVIAHEKAISPSLDAAVPSLTISPDSCHFSDFRTEESSLRTNSGAGSHEPNCHKGWRSVTSLARHNASEHQADQRTVINKTPATMSTAPRMMRKFTVSILRRKIALKKTVKSGVVLSSGMITDS